MLLKMAEDEVRDCKVYDPSTYPDWTMERYKDHEIEYVKKGFIAQFIFLMLLAFLMTQINYLKMQYIMIVRIICSFKILKTFFYYCIASGFSSVYFCLNYNF